MSAAPATRETKNAYSCDTPRSRGLTGSRSTAPGFEAEGFVTTRTPEWPARHPGAPEDLHAPRAGVHRGPCGGDGTCLVGRTGATYVVAREEGEHNDTHAGR